MSDEEPELRGGTDETEAPQVPSGKSVTKLFLGLSSFCVPVLLGVAAIVFMLVMILSANSHVREAVVRVQNQNNLKQIVISFHKYYDGNSIFHPATVYSKEGRPLYSWRVLMLPYLGHDDIYKRFHLDEAWDSPHNMQFLKEIPDVYVSPYDPEEAQRGLTHYQVFVANGSEPGPRPVFVNNPITLVPFDLGIGQTFQTKGGAPTIRQITDGLSNTILVADAANPVPWTKPEELAYSNRGPLPRLATHGTGRSYVAMGDWSCRSIDLSKLSEQTFRNAITMDDGKELGPDWEW